MRTTWLLGILLWASASLHVEAQTTAQKRALLAPVKRLMVVAPFFGTDTLLGEEPPDPKAKPKPKPKPKRPEKEPTEEERKLRETYVGYLQKLEERAKARLPERLKARTPFEVLPEEEIQKALKALESTPQKLFQSHGRIKNFRFPLPDPEAIKALAQSLKADALLLGVMDEPRKTNGGYYFTPFSAGYESGHVRVKMGFFLLLADGTTVCKETIEVLRPLTKIGEREYLLTDWEEAQAQVFENLLDEMVRYTPPKP